MELRKIIGSQAVRLIPVIETEQKPVSFARFLKAIEQKYSFLQVPRVLAEFNPQIGITFQKGLFSDQLIERFVIYNKGVLCESAANSDICDKFLDDIQAWGEQEFGFSPNSRKERSNYYESHLEVHVDEIFKDLIQRFSAVGQSIFELLKSYGQPGTMFELSGLKLNTDTIQLPESALYPLQFALERRVGHPYFANIYYAIAPLRTEDHINVLQKLEAVLKG